MDFDGPLLDYDWSLDTTPSLKPFSKTEGFFALLSRDCHSLHCIECIRMKRASAIWE